MRRRVLFLLAVIGVRLLLVPINQTEVKQVQPFAIWRESLASKGGRLLPEPEAGLVLGIVMGYKSKLDKVFYENLVNSGTVHMVVASGYNVMLVASVVMSGLLFVTDRIRATFVGTFVMIIYMLLTGAEVSVIRAGLMAGTALWSSAVGRRRISWWVLFLTAWTMLCIEPALIGNISFQLSVAATFGVSILAPFLAEKLANSGAILTNITAKIEFLPTICAIGMTLPITLFYFGRVSLVSPIANVLILPLMPLIMAFGAIMLTASLIFWPAAVVISWPVYAISHLMVMMVNYFGGAT